MVIENHALLSLHVNFAVCYISCIHSILCHVSNNDVCSDNLDKQHLFGHDAL